MDDIVYVIASVLAVALICGSFVYGCTRSNQEYYAAFNQCISSGGSAVPTGSNNNTIACIKK